MNGRALAANAGARTCYTHTIGMKLGDAHKQDISMFPEEFQDAEFADNFEYRSDCAARTWMRQHAVESLMYAPHPRAPQPPHRCTD